MSFTSTTRTRTARKEHKCDFCGQTIEIGSRYVSRAGVHQNDFWFFKSHPECDKATDKWTIDDWDGFDWGSGHRPVVANELKIEIAHGPAQEEIDIKVWNTKRVEISSTLKTGGEDPEWDAAIDAFEATVVAFLVPGGMDLHSSGFKQAVEQALESIANHHG